MADKVKYIYGEQFAQKLPGSNQNFYFRTVTGYKVDGNGKPIEGTARTDLYYAPKPGQANSRGVVWIPGSADSIDNFNPGGWVRAGSTADNGKTYSFRNYTQEDADLGRIPPGKNVGDEVLGATTQLSLTTSGGRFYEAVQNNLINLAVNTQPGLAQVVSAKQANAAAAAAQAQQKGKFDLLDETNRAVIKDAEGQRENYNDPNGGAWVYPTKLRDNGQDYIKFDIVQYEPRQFKLNNKTGEILEPRNSLKKSKGTICLPIQPSITDMNTVDWNGLGVNPLDLGLTNLSMQLASGQGTQGIENIFEYMTSQATNNSALVNAGKLALAQKAAGVTGLLSRVTGAVVNSNMELLFQGPQLRPFNFTFKLSPRDKDDARIVKGIIRAFKEAMAVKVASSQLFLKAPNVFEIKYIRGRTEKAGEIDPHPSLNKIKTCALQACNVDYTPDGTYMTFADPSATMTSYNITLQFQELEPVTSKDYDKNYTEIGY